jgi:hypothetical protein
LGPAGSRCDSAATTTLGEDCDRTGRHLWLRKEWPERARINDFLTIIFIGRFEFPPRSHRPIRVGIGVAKPRANSNGRGKIAAPKTLKLRDAAAIVRPSRSAWGKRPRPFAPLILSGHSRCRTGLRKNETGLWAHPIFYGLAQGPLAALPTKRWRFQASVDRPSRIDPPR